jgi:hypothetical protein
MPRTPLPQRRLPLLLALLLLALALAVMAPAAEAQALLGAERAYVGAQPLQCDDQINR